MVTKQNEKRSEQIVIMLTKKERALVEKFAEKLKGSNSQVFRYALSKLENENAAA